MCEMNRNPWLEPLRAWLKSAQNVRETVEVFGSNLLLESKKPVEWASNRGRSSSKRGQLVKDGARCRV